MIFDSHLHTNGYSPDAEMSLKEACQTADKLGIGLITTEHMDLMFEDERFTFKPAEYLQDYGKWRSDRLLLGIELGMQLKSAAVSREIIENHDYDYVLGSLHVLFDTDLYYKECYAGRSKQEVYDAYFQTMLDNLQQHRYIDSLAHIDYLCRYADFVDTEIVYSNHQALIDAVLSFLTANDIVLEINTRRLGSRKAVKYVQALYRRYSELGGRYVTIGSDAHTLEGIGSNFKQALELAEYNGLQPVYFKNRKMTLMK